MESYGFVWNLVESYNILIIYAGMCERSTEVSGLASKEVSHEVPNEAILISMDSIGFLKGSPRTLMDSNGLLSNRINSSGLLWNPMPSFRIL